MAATQAQSEDRVGEIPTRLNFLRLDGVKTHMGLTAQRCAKTFARPHVV